MKELVIDSYRMRSGTQICYRCRKCTKQFYSEKERNKHAYLVHIVESN